MLTGRGAEVIMPSNHRLKQPGRPVTPLALQDGGPGTDPGWARSAPVLVAAYPGAFARRL